MRPADNIHKLIKNTKIKTNPEVNKAVLDGLLDRMDRAEGVHINAPRQNIWRIIMKNKVTKIAAAAVIIIAVLIGINSFPGTDTSVAFADVVKPFLFAKTATFKTQMNVKGTPLILDSMYKEPLHMRFKLPGMGTIVMDLNQRKAVLLITSLKQYVPIPVIAEKMPQNLDPEHFNMFGLIRKCIIQSQQSQSDSIQYLGEEVVNGRTVISFSCKSPTSELSIWADKQNKTPIRFKLITESYTLDITDIVLDVELDDSLFSLEIPEGYKEANKGNLEASVSQGTEEDLIEAFRSWSTLADGKFPPDLEMMTGKDFAKKVMKEKGPVLDLIWPIAKGFKFAEKLPSESNFKYVGKGVTVSDAETAIFWYRPEGSQTYRVIYSNLTVEDVAAEDLPE